MNRQASPEHQRGETVKTAGEDRCGEPTPGKNRLVIYQRTGNGIRDANQNRVPGTDAEHECENESGGGIPGGETQFGKQDDFRAIQEQVKEDKQNGQSNVGEPGSLPGPGGELRKSRSRRMSQAESQCVAFT